MSPTEADFQKAREALLFDAGWPRYVANEVEIEVRRLLELRQREEGARFQPTGLVQIFWRQAGGESNGGRPEDEPTGDLRRHYTDAFGRMIPAYWETSELGNFTDTASPSFGG